MTLPAAFGGTDSPNQNIWHRRRIASSIFNGVRYQAICYYTPSLHVAIAVRTRPSGDWVAYTYDGSGGRPSLQLAAYDESHMNTTIAIDSTGYIHFTWNGTREWNVVSLQYRKSTSTIDQWDGSVTANLQMTGFAESQYNYPMMFKDPMGSLYFSYRDGVSYSADWYLKRYNTSTQTWAGVGATNGKIIQGKTNDSVYAGAVPCFTPDWDGAGTGRMYFAWCWRYADVPSGYFDVNVMYWTGSGTTWKKVDGSAQTVPATVDNSPQVLEVRDSGGFFPLTSVYDMSCNDDGSEVWLRFTRRPTAGGADSYTAIRILNGVVTTATGYPGFYRSFFDRYDQKFKFLYWIGGAMYRTEQISGMTESNAEPLGDVFGPSSGATSRSPGFFDDQLLTDTGVYEAMRIPNTASANIELVTVCKLLKTPAPSPRYGENTYSFAIRYAGESASASLSRAV